MPVDGSEHRAQEEQELQVVLGRASRRQQVDAVVGADGPVVVLAAAVDSREGLLMQQAHESVLLGGLLHDLHDQLVLVGGDIDSVVDAGELMLRRGNLVVLRLGGDAELPEPLVELLHERGLLGRYGSEVVVVELLRLGGRRPEQGPSGISEVFPLLIQILGDEEIFLLRADVRAHPLCRGVAEQSEHPHGFPVEGVHGAQQRGLLVQRLARVGAEGCGDEQCLSSHESVGSGIPRGVSSGFKSRPKSP